MTYKTVDLVQGSEEWLDWRMTKWCASEASIIMGCAPKWSKYKTWDDLSLIKAGFAEYDDWATKAMEWGAEREQEALAYACEHLGSYKPACIENLDEPKLCASLDGLHVSGDEVHWLEIKCPVPMSSSKGRWYDLVGDFLDLPKSYQWQAMHQFLALGVKEAFLDYLIFPDDRELIRFRTHFHRAYHHMDFKNLLEQWRQWEDGGQPGRADNRWMFLSNHYLKVKGDFERAKDELAEARKEMIRLVEDDFLKLPYGNGVRVDETHKGYVVRQHNG